VAGEYPRGRRFDYRYRFYGARNHVVLLVTALGWRDAHVRRYARTVASRVARHSARGVAALWRRPSPRAKVRGLLGGMGQAGIEGIGTVAGVFAATGAMVRLRRQGSP
jgi:hypothetical protein